MDLNAATSAISKIMREKGVHSGAINAFVKMVEKVGRGAAPYVDLNEVEEPDSKQILDPTDQEKKELESLGNELLAKTVIIKLNGGRSTTMGGEVPKGILQCKGELSYLDIVAKQILAIKEKMGVQVKLCLMNSFFTHEQSMEKMAKYDFPVLSFIQSKAPRLNPSTLTPVNTFENEVWAPPGHGDLYQSLDSSGIRAGLIEQGYKWAFVSNMDNLAATLEPWILGLIQSKGIDFLLEVTKRTQVDRKGGTLVVRDGKVDLLEIAQVAPDHLQEFMDISRFRVFNTNNLWLDLEKVDPLSMDMPIIQNRKVIHNTEMLQLETAMGAAIGSFERSRGLLVGRDRFFPTKKAEDLFVVQSDACVLDDMFRLQPNPLRPDHLPMRPWVKFEDDFIKSALEIPRRFDDMATVSLLEAEYFEVSGNVFFERDVKIKGRVVIKGTEGKELRIEKGSILEDISLP